MTGMESPNSRACPAKDLAFAILVNFMRAFLRSANTHVSGGTANSFKQVWRPQDSKDEDVPMPRLTGYGVMGIDHFTKDLSKVVAALESERSGMSWVEQLSEQERATLRESVKVGNKFAKTNFNTRTFIKLVASIVTPELEAKNTDVAGKVLPKADYTGAKAWCGPFNGGKVPRLIVKDEDEGKPGALATFLKAIGLTALEKFDFSEDLEAGELIWFDSPAEGVLSMDETFGYFLPPQYNSWDNVGTDEGVAWLCTSGIGQWYLGPARTSEASGHAVPAGAVLECNVEWIGKYGTRKTWCRYGATVYLGALKDARESAAPGALLGVWTCHHGRLFAPGDELWEHAKTLFRSTLITAITLKDHLAVVHWTMANGLHLAAREAVGASHPLRRLLRLHYFRTASINYSSQQVLLPVDGFAFRTFGFTASRA